MARRDRAYPPCHRNFVRRWDYQADDAATASSNRSEIARGRIPILYLGWLCPFAIRGSDGKLPPCPLLTLLVNKEFRARL